MVTLADAGLVKVCLSWPDGKGGMLVRVVVLTAEDLAAVLARIDEVSRG